MVLSNFIRRNHGKRKANKAIESRTHKQSFSASEPSQVVPSWVLDINEESLAAQRSPVVQLNLSNSNEEWFPHELLRRSSPSGFLRRTQIIREDLAQETRTSTSPAPSLPQSESAPSAIASSKKSIPTPIIIPDHPMPKYQIGNSTRVLPSTPDCNDNLNQLSPSVSENLSSISGTTLARDLIGSSFVLLSSEHRSLRHRSGVARQDSATLPRGSFFLFESSSSSPIPPVPPVPANLAAVSPDSSYPPTGTSGASTESEYPLSESCFTSPEMANGSVLPRRMFRTQESTLSDAHTSAKDPLVSNITPQRKGGPVLTRTRVPISGMFDAPKSAVDPGPFPIISQETPLHSSPNESSLPSSDGHSLDEFDSVQPKPVVLTSPESDAGASYVSPAVPLAGHSGINRAKGKRRAGGLHLINTKLSLSDSEFASEHAHCIPSASVSELDYGELFHYDLTVSPGTSLSSSASAGYQTFPETPVALSPLGSAKYYFFARSDSLMLRRRTSSIRSVGAGSKKFSYIKSVRRQVATKDGAAILRRSPVQKMPSPKGAEPNLPLCVPIEDDAAVPEVNLVNADRPRSLFHLSSSSSYVVEEEALRALAKLSPSSLPSMTVADVDPSIDTTAIPIPDSAPSVSVPLPESTDISPFNSPSLNGGSTLFSPSTSPLCSSLPTTSTFISQSDSLLSPPTSSLAGSSFLAPLSPSSSAGDPLSRTNSPTVPDLPSVAPDELTTESSSPSFLPPPPYHIVVSERPEHQAGSIRAPSLSRIPSAEQPVHSHSRQGSNSSLASGFTRPRGRSRPIGPRKPSVPRQSCGPLFPGIRARNGSTSSVGSVEGFPWHKLCSAASKPPPKFKAPPPKWCGHTLEAAQWTFTSSQLQQLVSDAIQQSSEGSALRYLRPDVLEGEIAEELQRLELQHVDVKAQYKALSRRRWMLMGALAGYVGGVAPSDAAAAHTLEELAEVLVALDGLADKMHDTVLQMAQLKRLRDVHDTSALAMAVRKISDLLLKQVAEKERLREQVDTLRTERDEAWKSAQDYDTLNDRVSESACGASTADASSATGSRRSTQVSVKRKSKAGLRSRSRSRHRAATGRSPGDAALRSSSLALDDMIPPVPRLRLNPSVGSSQMSLPSGWSFGSTYYTGTPGASGARALAEAQREVYEMLGLSVPPSQASSRRRTLSGSTVSRPPSSPKPRPASESLGTRTGVVRRMRSRPGPEWGPTSRSTRSMIVDGVRSPPTP